MITLRRIADGVSAHFPQRVSEWLMVWPCVGMGVALNLQREMFQTSPSFAQLERWLGETEWAFLALMCGAIRLAALTINGTFAGFRYSPHLRISASFVSAFFWMQLCLGFVVPAASGHGGYLALVAYSTFVLAEAANVYRASRDIGPRGAAWKTY